MGVDSVLKRYFPAVVCVLIALAAYFQASGMGQLVASSVAVDPSSVPAGAPAPRSGASSAPNLDHATSSESILSRNPFDSVTGPLNGKPVEIHEPTTVVENHDNAYEDPICDGTKVLIITQADDPEWSFAAMAGPDGASILRRQGDEINGKQVLFVGRDRVWLTASGARCQSKLFPDKEGAKAVAAVSPPPEPTSTTRRRGKKIPPELAAKIHKVSDTEFNVERSAVDQILENQAEFMRTARIVPEKEGDKVVGIRLFGIRPDSLLGSLGLENGDRLSSINGFEMTDPQKALEAYARLRSADRLTVNVNRKGKPMNIDFNIK
jgi:general secretion pathway protein C